MHCNHKCKICGSKLSSTKYRFDDTDTKNRVIKVRYCLYCDIAVLDNKKGDVSDYQIHNSKSFHTKISRVFYKERKLKIKKKSLLLKKVIDFGCGAGDFVKYLTNKGIIAFGIDNSLRDPTPPLNIFVGNQYVLKKLKNFDAITVFHSLGYLSDPVEFINLCSQTLKPGGLIFISTPNYNSFARKYLKQRWCYFDPYYYKYIYTTKSLIKLLEVSEFSILKVYKFSWEYDLFGWILSITNYFNKNYNEFYSNLNNSKFGDIRKYTFFIYQILIVMVSTVASLFFIIYQLITGQENNVSEIIAIKKHSK